MAGAECCSNPPELSPSAGLGTVRADFGGLRAYVTGSPDSTKAVLLVSDIFGFEAPNLRKLADKVAAAGFFVVVPDFLYGDPYQPDNPENPLPTWLKSHGADKGFEDAKPVITAIKNKGISAIGAAGFCWGAKVVAELAKSEDIQAVVMLHPSFVSVDDIKEVKVPIQILGAEYDKITPPEVVIKFEEVLSTNSAIDSLVKIFPGATHGWTVRYDINDEAAVKQAEEAHQDMACYICDHGLSAIGQNCKQLEDLTLRFCDGITDTGLVELAHCCGKSLTTLGLAACTQITDTSLEAVGYYCSSLEALSLDSEIIKDRGVIAVAKGCRSLKYLKMQCINVSDEALQIVGSHCLSLELLALYNSHRFSDRGLSALGKGCKKLKNLTLSDCHLLSDRSLEHIATGCNQLTHLEVNGCYNVGTFGLESIGKNCPNLVELVLLYCQRIGKSAFLEIGRGCKQLQALHLGDCLSIDDDAMCYIAQGCKNLRKLHIRRCYEIGSKGIVTVGENCKFLSDLTLRFCERVGDDAITAIAKNHSLQHLNVSGCHLIGDVGITAVARGCPELVSLDVSVLQNLGDIALAELGEGCPLLKDIVLSHCQQITDTGVARLVGGCSHLETCQMVYCPLVTSSGVATVISSCISLKKVLVERWKVSERTRRRARSILSYLCIDL